MNVNALVLWTYFPFFSNKDSIFLSDLSSPKTMCLSHPHRKTSFIQQQCEITMFRDWWGAVGGWGWAPNRKEKSWEMSGNKVTPKFIRFLSPLRSRVESDWYHFTQKGNNKDKEVKGAMVSSHISKTLALYTISRGSQASNLKKLDIC